MSNILGQIYENAKRKSIPTMKTQKYHHNHETARIHIRKAQSHGWTRIQVKHSRLCTPLYNV